MKNPVYLISLSIFLLFICRQPVFAQPDSIMGPVSLQQCIGYALKNQPAVQQALLDEEIGERDIGIALAGWAPQISGQANLSRFLKQPVSLLNGEPVIFQPEYNSNFQVQADQALFNNDLLLASRGSKFIRRQTQQNTENNKINTVVDVSKAFYDILTSEEQLSILREDIARVDKQLKDSYAQYQAGLVDKTDYKRASISLSNSKANLKRIAETLKGKYAYLKQLMGYPTGQNLELNFDNNTVEREVLLDTLQQLRFESRVEYRQLQTEKQIQQLNVDYYRYGFLPELSAFINYNVVYQGNQFSTLYDQDFPNSQTGLRLAIPIFQGTRRLQNLRKAKLEERRLDLDIIETKNAINTEYQQAMANYKSNLNDWKTYRQNVELSKEVYNTIKLQYNEGIKTYLELLVAESDLRSSQLNYLNSLFSLLSSKLDVQRSLGAVPVNQ